MKINENKISRRGFFKRSGTVMAGSIAAAAVLPSIFRSNKSHAAHLPAGSENEVLQMQADLVESLKKPIEKRKWAMIVDARKCIGCHACSIACIAENNLPPGVTYRKVLDVEDGEFPNVQRYLKPTNCMQCENAPCIKAANAVIPGSMDRRPDGIVTINYSKMKGKKVFESAKKACPYEYALYYDEGKNYTDNTPALQKYEMRKVKEYGKEVTRKETKDTTRKCHFCIHRIDDGVLPACVTTCTGRAMYFGDLNNADALAIKYLKANENFVLNEGAKTLPTVKFIHDNLDETCLKCHG